MKKVIVSAVCLSIMSGCAEKSEKIAPAYVSPIAYQSHSCRQLQEEAQRLSSRASAAMGVQDKTAHDDAVATGVALVLFWPAAFFIKGGKQNSAEVARLKGEMDAVEQASIRKNCRIAFPKVAPEKAADATTEQAEKPLKNWSK